MHYKELKDIYEELKSSEKGLTEEEAKKILSVWLQTPFSKEERHKRRIQKISEIENQ